MEHHSRRDGRQDRGQDQVSGAARHRGRRGRPPTGVRDKVLATAETILAENGIARLSTKEIARRAGVAESSIFYHFDDRLGLLQAVIRMRLPQYTRTAQEITRRAGEATLKENLEALLNTLENFYLDIMPTVVAIQADSALRLAFVERRQVLDFGPERALGPVADYLSRERDIGRIRGDVDLRAASLVVISVAHQRAVQRYVGTASDRPPGTAAVVEILLPVLAMQ